MDAVKTTKWIVKAVSTVCVSKITKDIINNHVEIETPVEKAEVFIGSWVIGAMISERIGEYYERRFDETTKAWEEYKAEVDETEEKDVTDH